MNAHTATARSLFRDASETAHEAASMEPVSIGMHYVHHAALMKGEPSADGRCFYMLETYPIPDGATPGQVRDMVFHPSEAQYKVYFGHMSRRKGDAGMVVGYVEECFVDPTLSVARAHEMQDGVIGRIQPVSYPRPRVLIDWDAQRFGNYQPLLAGGGEVSAIEAKISRIRDPRPAPVRSGLRCIGG